MILRCEDCIALVEEYFDGEVDATTGERMSAHISACADCAAALDALSFEGEIYARYERGLEPAPALWTRVSAEIARAPQTGAPANGHRFLRRALESIAAALGALSLRPALASSLALLLVAVTAGSLWLARRPRSTELPLLAATEKTSVPAQTSPRVESAIPDRVGAKPFIADSNIAGAATFRKISTTHASSVHVKEAGLTDDDIRHLLDGEQQTGTPNESALKPDAGGHAVADTIAQLVDTPKAGAGFVTASAQLPDAGEKEMTRHVEQTQMLLRSIKNARASDDGGTVNVVYEKKLSRRLLSDNATLKLEAEVKGDRDTKQVLDTIEPFLLDIANMRDQPSREEVRSFRERVKKTEIIASLQVY